MKKVKDIRKRGRKGQNGRKIRKDIKGIDSNG